MNGNAISQTASLHAGGSIQTTKKKNSQKASNNLRKHSIGPGGGQSGQGGGIAVPSNIASSLVDKLASRLPSVFHLYSTRQASEEKAGPGRLNLRPMKKKKIPTRDSHLRVRLTPKERKKLEREAQLRGMRLSDFVRRVLTEKSLL